MNFGRILSGPEAALQAGWNAFERMPVDRTLPAAEMPAVPEHQQTVAREVTVSGQGTFEKKNRTTITFAPSEQPGWWFDRVDRPRGLPIRVSVRNVWTTGQIVSNIVLRSGGAHNYVRMVEHIVALKAGLNIDNLLIRIDSGDPPLFDRGSLDLVEALDRCGVCETRRPVRRYTVREKVVVAAPNGAFLMVEPPQDGRPLLTVDCGISFKTAIGDQRIQFPVTEEWVRYGALARTNTPWMKMLYCQTIGRLFANIRNLGYTRENILIARRNRYVNEPRLQYQGKSLEAVWHRGVLDLLAAVALIEEGRFCGHITSFKAGHRLDVELVKQLYLKDLLVRL
jgi:UDP-3-O-acyl-N-acetylglucosamine deacetylase